MLPQDKLEIVPAQLKKLSKVISEWEDLNGKKISEEEWVDLIYRGINELDPAGINSLVFCKKLSLSSNMIARLPDIQLKNLEILSLGRNKIKNLKGLDFVGGTLKQLWISYNDIDRLDGLRNLLKLEVLYIGNNNIGSADELNVLVKLILFNLDKYDKSD